MQANFAQKLWKINRPFDAISTNRLRDTPPLRTQLQMCRPEVEELAPENFWESIDHHNGNIVVTVIAGSMVRDKIYHRTCVFEYYLGIMANVPNDLIARRSQVANYEPPRLTIHCESGNEQIFLSSIADPSLPVQIESLRIKSMLYHHQSHIAFDFIHFSTHQPITMHFLLCSTPFLNDGLNIPHIAATQPFVNYPILPAQSQFILVGIIGPSVAYSSTGKDLRVMFRQFQMGLSEVTGYELLRSTLRAHFLGWRPLVVQTYRERKGLTWTRKSARDISLPKRSGNALRADVHQVLGRITQQLSQDGGVDHVNDSHVLPDVLPNILPDNDSNILPDVLPDVLPNVLPDILPDVLPDVLPDEILSSSPPNTINLAPIDDPSIQESSISDPQSRATADPLSPGYNEIVNGFDDGSSDWFETSQLPAMSWMESPSHLTSGKQSWVIISSPSESLSPSPVASISVSNPGSPTLASVTSPFFDPSDFNTLPRSIDLNPLLSISLVELTWYLLWARQRGRNTRLRTRWELHFVEIRTDGTRCYRISFDGNVIVGIRLIEVPSEDGKLKLCIFGCRKSGRYQWIGSPDRQKTHAAPQLSGGGRCTHFPHSLSCTSRAAFCTARQLDGLDIYFRQTREGTGHLTSLLILGLALLNYALEKLMIVELMAWKLMEMGVGEDEEANFENVLRDLLENLE